MISRKTITGLWIESKISWEKLPRHLRPFRDILDNTARLMLMLELTTSHSISKVTSSEGPVAVRLGIKRNWTRQTTVTYSPTCSIAFPRQSGNRSRQSILVVNLWPRDLRHPQSSTSSIFRTLLPECFFKSFEIIPVLLIFADTRNPSYRVWWKPESRPRLYLGTDLPKLHGLIIRENRRTIKSLN
jgi:hypothetical protein